ncbi:hypothetical protein N7486_006665 [Penicillium sp. IBT 16267x]|nr:hypothetical protein N7486_006665 [Penicillium sp. IBT 16267x]
MDEKESVLRETPRAGSVSNLAHEFDASNQSERTDTDAGGSKSPKVVDLEKMHGKRQVQYVPSPGNSASENLTSKLPQNIEPDDYLVVLYDFTAGSDNELTIKRGQFVMLIQTDHSFDDDEWWLGEEIHTKKMGWFPAAERYTFSPYRHAFGI